MKVKPWYKSKTIIWALISICITLAAIVSLVIAHIKHEESVFSMLVANLVANMQTIHGRIRAEHKVVITKKQMEQYKKIETPSITDVLLDVIELISEKRKK